ncbi:hypothetical protein LTS18_011927, partial [Coniosporium uncinatum]
AAKELNGIRVDGNPIKIEVMVAAQGIPASEPAKSLKDRITQPKNAAKAQPKPATAVKPAAGKTATRGRKAKPAKNARPKKKTAEELDAEMVDYFGDNNAASGAPVNGADAAVDSAAVQPVANGGDTGMDDEIS